MIAQNNPTQLEQEAQEQTPRLMDSKIFLWGVAVVSALAAAASLVFGILQNFWPLYLLSGAFAVTLLMTIFAASSVWNAPLSLKLLAATLIFEVSIALVSGIFPFAYGAPAAAIAFVVAFLFVAYNPSGWLNEWIIGLGLLGALGSAVLGVLTPMPYLSNSYVNYGLAGLAVLAVLLLAFFFITGRIIASLRLKLTMGALALAVLPLLILAFISLRLVQNTVSAQSNESLRVATQLTVNQLDNFISSNISSLEAEASLPVFTNYLNLNPDLRTNSSQEQELKTTLTSLQAQESQYPPSYGVINLSGVEIYNTNSHFINQSILTTDFFKKSSLMQASFASTVEFIPNSHESYIYFITPIFNESQAVIGYLLMQYDSHILQAELEKTAGIIGAHSYPILVDQNGFRLADTSNPNLIYHAITPISNTLYTKLLNSNLLPSYITREQIVSQIKEISQSVFTSPVKPYQFFTVNLEGATTGIMDSATYGPLTQQKWYIVYLQEQNALVAAQKSLTQTTAVVSVLIASIVAFLITIVSTLFTRPITQLTQSAEEFAAGNLDTQVAVTTRDEIGALARTFNTMASQLKTSIENLENRVRERTLQLSKQNDDLQYRSRQLQTVADVARGVVSSTDMGTLLTRVTTLISDRFNFYHVGIFLNDDKNEYSVLRASNSSGGQRMLSRQHKLKVGQIGIVGYVTGSGSPRIATDVGQDAVFFNNPDLPLTKSEMALPLKIENQVIGALDIQSTESNAFTEGDVNLFTTLADQISIAINNNRLLERTQNALDEAQNLHRQYLNQEWTKRSTDSGRTSYRYTSQGLSVTDEELPEVKMVFETGRPVTRSSTSGSQSEKTYSSLAVPILLRGEVIGVIQLQENDESNYAWSENDLTTLTSISDQLAQTLEGARLFEQTIRRADRERRVLEITSKIRSTNDPQKMLEITLEELKRHLGASQAQIVLNLSGNLETFSENIQENSKVPGNQRTVTA